MLICTKIDIEDQIISFKYYCSPTALIICQWIKETNLKNENQNFTACSKITVEFCALYILNIQKLDLILIHPLLTSILSMCG